MNKSTHSKTFELVKPIGDYLVGYTIVALLVIVNILTLNLKLKPDEMTNSTLIITPRGTGKSTLLHHILKKSNSKYFPGLPDKMYESQLMEESDDIFTDKVWVLDDLVTTFRGTSTKQREQLMGFFNTFLGNGEYSRNRVTKRGRIVCIFGFASEGDKKYSKEMLQFTFTDRLVRIRMDIDIGLKGIILQKRRKYKTKSYKLPKAKLPIRPRSIDMNVPEKIGEEIDKIALELDKEKVVSSNRAQTMIENFIKVNAWLNGRKEPSEDDLRLFKFVLPLYLRADTGSVDMRIRMFILEKAMEGEAVKGNEIKARIKSDLKCSDSAIQRVLSDLRQGGIVLFNKIPLGRGYDYEYWI